jgi:hypothetical protein
LTFDTSFSFIYFWLDIFNISIEILIECPPKEKGDWNKYEYQNMRLIIFCILTSKNKNFFTLSILNRQRDSWRWPVQMKLEKRNSKFLDSSWVVSPVGLWHHPWVMGMQPLITLFLLAPSQVGVFCILSSHENLDYINPQHERAYAKI